MRADAKVVYTYDVYWELTDISWASRWDAYLRMPGGRVHWFSILNSLMVVVVMSSIVAMIMLRTIRRDLARYEGILGDAGGLPICLKSLPGPANLPTARPHDCCERSACQSNIAPHAYHTLGAHEFATVIGLEGSCAAM